MRLADGLTCASVRNVLTSSLKGGCELGLQGKEERMKEEKKKREKQKPKIKTAQMPVDSKKLCQAH